MQQEEMKRVGEPLRIYMEYLGWFIIKTHGNQFQAGLPDWYCSHRQYSPKWVELKLIGGAFTKHQLIVFPKLIMNNVPIWVIEGDDFRGMNGKQELHRAYNKLFEQPNAAFYLHHSNRRLFHA